MGVIPFKGIYELIWRIREKHFFLFLEDINSGQSKINFVIKAYFEMRPGQLE